jgi:nicotinamidase-related amidase
MNKEHGVWTYEDCALVLIDRSSMNAFEDDAFGEAVKATARKRLIIGGLHTEICAAAALQGAK